VATTMGLDSGHELLHFGGNCWVFHVEHEVLFKVLLFDIGEGKRLVLHSKFVLKHLCHD